MVHWLVIRSYRPCSFWLMNPAALRPPSPNTGSDHDEKNMRTIRQEMHSFFQHKYFSTFHLHLLLVWIFQCCSDKKNKTWDKSFARSDTREWKEKCDRSKINSNCLLLTRGMLPSHEKHRCSSRIYFLAKQDFHSQDESVRYHMSNYRSQLNTTDATQHVLCWSFCSKKTASD